MIQNKALRLCLFLFPVLLLSREIDIGKVIAYPNPYAPNTSTVPLTLKLDSGNNILSDFQGAITMIVYDASLIQIYQKDFPAGQNQNVNWNGIDQLGNRVSPGLYYIRVIENRDDGSTGKKFVKVIVR